MRPLLCLLGVIVGLGCAADRELRPYYFPFKSLTEGLVYEYQPTDSIGTPFYAYYRTLYEDDKTYLTVMFYDHTYTPTQFVSERLVNSGALLERQFLYFSDSTEKQVQIPVAVKSNNVFPFKLATDTPPGVLLMEMSYRPPDQPDATLTLVRNRQYARDTTWTYRGEPYEAVVFTLRELIEHDREGTLEQEYGGTEIYAEGLGLVYSEKRISEGFQLRYVLADRYPMEVFLERAGQGPLPTSLDLE